ncbi:N-acetylneuraminate synthase family protein [Nesterenkonia sp.]|uniref:N-acetylneuraminate synthase family protein n=1 Tax=Nesterenkonia sp. TaxID=704201 RepID=UPI002605D28B|nr:N-acetylneuraminate synthase family protein [Nesterenkonia sp.]
MTIGNRTIGPGHPTYVIGEIGLNHNGSVETAKKLMDVAKEAGADAVKFQKRNPEVSTPAAMRDKRRETPWGEMSYLEYRYKVEFERPQYEEIAKYAEELELDWFASPWDVDSVKFLEDMGAVTHKVASASLYNDDILKALAETGKPIIASTGMSNIEDVDHAVEILGTDNLALLHTSSTYPMPAEEANLKVIPMLAERYGVPVGWSGHEPGLQISVAAVALGAAIVERHITLDRTMWGSDQAASVEPQGFTHLVRDIRVIEKALGTPEKRVQEGEKAKIASLRG